MSDDFTRARDATRALFSEVKVIRPEGTRSSSFEVFLVGLGRKAARPGGARRDAGQAATQKTAAPEVGSRAAATRVANASVLLDQGMLTRMGVDPSDCAWPR